MLLSMLKSKLHLARVTESVREYEGSLTVDEDLLDAVKIRPYERILVSNMENGQRFETYAIAGKRGSGVIGLNGPTTHCGAVGDRIVILAFGFVPHEDVARHRPLILILNDQNKPVGPVRAL